MTTIPDTHRDLLSDLRDRDKPGDTRVVVTIVPARVIAWG